MTVYSRAVDLMEAALGDELVALDPKAGECFGFNSVATSVWRQLERPRTFAQLCDGLVDEFEVDRLRCQWELAELLEDLRLRGLVQVSPSLSES